MMTPAENDQLEAVITELRSAVRDVRGKERKSLPGQSNGWASWVLGMVAVLLTVGVMATVKTSASVSSIQTDLGLLRAEVGREFSRLELEIRTQDARLDDHLTGGIGGDGS